MSATTIEWGVYWLEEAIRIDDDGHTYSIGSDFSTAAIEPMSLERAERIVEEYADGFGCRLAYRINGHHWAWTWRQ